MNVDKLTFHQLLQTTTSSFLKSPNQLDLAVNVNGENLGSVTKRLGYAQSGSDVSTGNSILGLRTYPYMAGGTQLLFGVANGTIYDFNGTTWASVQSGLNTTAKAEFRVFVDQLFMVGANSSNTYLTTANISGTIYSTSTNVTNAPKGRFIEQFKSRLYIADVEVSGTRYPSRFYWSSAPTDGAITWDTSATSESFEEVSTDNGEPIMGLHTNEALNQLLIFKETSLHSWDTYRIRNLWNVGTTSGRSIVTIDGITYFFNKNGIYAYDGARAKLISRPIKKWIKGISASYYDDVFGINQDDEYLKMFVGDCTVDGKTYSNCEIIYNVADQTWTIYSYADPFSCYATHEESGVTRVYGGTTAGKVHKLAQDSDAVYDDNGTAIAAEFMFTVDLGLPSERKFVDRVLIYTTAVQNLTGRIRAKGKDWSTWFPINETEQSHNVNPRDGRFLQFHFSETSNVAPFEFQGLSFNVTQTTKNYA